MCIRDSTYAELARRGHVSSAEVTPPRAKMARLPEGAEPLANGVGAAPGSSSPEQAGSAARMTMNKSNGIHLIGNLPISLTSLNPTTTGRRRVRPASGKGREKGV